MATTINEIVSEALALPSPVRALLAEKLIESVDASAGSELSPEWREEICRRCAEVQEETASLRNAEDVFAGAFARLT
jgi:putative addiction module component (TIGR02574 family)